MIGESEASFSRPDGSLPNRTLQRSYLLVPMLVFLRSLPSDVSVSLGFRLSLSSWIQVGLLCLFLIGAGVHSANAQAPLRAVNDETTVRKVSFRFVDEQTFEPNRLQEEIATSAPSFLDRLRNRFAFLPGIRRQQFPFDPLTLQKDVVRLRRFYQEQGFPNPQVDYPASQLDTTDNQIHVIFTIQEGPALTIRRANFFDETGAEAAATLFQDGMRNSWQAFREDQANFEIGERYTDIKRTQIEDEVRSWLRDRGFAFAQINSEAQIDTSANAVDLRFFVDPGPRGVVSEIQIEGNQAVSASIIRRELPFSEGDLFSASEVNQGQRQLFELNLFRVALADIPAQPRDSSVIVRYRVREAQLRSFSSQMGYGTQPGITLEGSWQHRNFFGNARTFIFGLVAETGYPENPLFLTRPNLQKPSRRFRASVTLRQPYLFTPRLSGSLAPFVQEAINPALDRDGNEERFLSLNERQIGVNSTLIYDLLPFRTLSLQHTFSRTRQFLPAGEVDTTQVDNVLVGSDDLFNRSVFSLSGTFGVADDFINPSRGFLLRPSVQLGGFFFESGVEFARISTEVSRYLPLSDNVDLAGRLFGGTLWPFGESRVALTASEDAPRRNRTYQNRFSDYFFYAGGGSDVRGWVSQLAGGKVLRTPTSRTEYAYQPLGARSKVGANLELRLPMPGLGSSWRTAAFVDAAYMTPGPLDLIPPSIVSRVPAGPDGNAVTSDPTQLLVGSGLGLRYETSFGFLRIDLAYKLTPDELDLRRPHQVGQAARNNQPVTDAPINFFNRFRLHFGIGRSF